MSLILIIQRKVESGKKTEGRKPQPSKIYSLRGLTRGIVVNSNVAGDQYIYE